MAFPLLSVFHSIQIEWNVKHEEGEKPSVHFTMLQVLFVWTHWSSEYRQSTNVTYTKVGILCNGCSFVISEVLQTDRFCILV